MELRGTQLPVLWHWRPEVPQIGDASLVAWGCVRRVAQFVGIGDDVPGTADAGRPTTNLRDIWQGMLIHQALQTSSSPLHVRSSSTEIDDNYMLYDECSASGKMTRSKIPVAGVEIRSTPD